MVREVEVVSTGTKLLLYASDYSLASFIEFYFLEYLLLFNADFLLVWTLGELRPE